MLPSMDCHQNLKIGNSPIFYWVFFGENVDILAQNTLKLAILVAV